MTHPHKMPSLPSRKAGLSFLLLFLLACSGPGSRMPTAEEMNGKKLLQLSQKSGGTEKFSEFFSEIPSVHRVIRTENPSGGPEYYLLIDSSDAPEVKERLRNEFGGSLEASAVPDGSSSLAELRAMDVKESSPAPTLDLPSIFDIFTRIP